MGTKLQDKVVVVTGASSGFGRAIAKACAAEGAKVVVSDVHENPNAGGFEDDAALTTVEAIEKLGGAGTYVGCDVTKEDQVERLVAETVRAYGRIDVMVNNAGVYRNGKRLHEFDEADLDVCYEVNVKGTFFGAKAAIRQMLEQGDGGVIVNLVSTAGLQGHPTSPSTTSPRARRPTSPGASRSSTARIGSASTGSARPTPRPRSPASCSTTRTSTRSSPSRSRSSGGARSTTSPGSPCSWRPTTPATSTGT
jgi:NAD(P)-dependent dehydrogenase (short-subunit alcohol dehydrogenase family)